MPTQTPTTPTTPTALRLNGIPGLSDLPLPSCLASPLEQALGLTDCNRVLGDIPADCSGTEFVRAALAGLSIRPEATPADLSHIPEEGGVMVVANHPYGMLDGLLLLDLVAQRRSDVRVLGNGALAAIPQLRPLLLGVDLWDDGKRKNALVLRQAINWLREGGALLVFPAGAVSGPRLRRGVVMDRPWRPSIGGILRHAGCAAVPAHVSGTAQLAVRAGSFLTPHLRVLAQPRQLLSARNRSVPVKVGNPVSPSRLARCHDDRDRSEYLQFRCYLLAEREREQYLPAHAQTAEQPVAEREPVGPMLAEIAKLTPVCGRGSRSVYVTNARYSPRLLKELGRLRELTFRGVGEGSGKSRDIDEFDQHCDQLLIWDHDDNEIVGAYRLREVNGSTDPESLYCNELYRIRPAFLREIEHGVELGRSFVQARYQKQFNALQLLWQGIGAYIRQRPGVTKLFGAVSISAEYSAASKQAIEYVLTHQQHANPYQGTVLPRHAPRFERLRGFQRDALTRWGTSVEELSTWIADLEEVPERQHIPVLVRQYARLGAIFTACNVDPEFAFAMDALIVVDLRQADPRQLRRFFGKDFQVVESGA
jgi:putative hemolysin